MARTIIVGDVHGCYETLQMLLREIQLTDEDRLISIGDLVDKGPRIRETLDFFLTRPRTHIIMGNHEYHFIDYFREGGQERNARMLRFGLQETLDQLGKTAREYAKKLARKPKYLTAIDRRYVFCHADWNWRSGETFIRAHLIRHINAETHADYEGPVIVHGHTPCPPEAMYEWSTSGRLLGINLDGGCYAGMNGENRASLRAMITDNQTLKGTIHEVAYCE